MMKLRLAVISVAIFWSAQALAGSVSVGPTSANPGAAVVVTVTSDGKSRGDWVQISKTTDAANVVNDSWVYLSGTRDPPPAPKTSANFQMVAPGVAGAYEVRLYLNDTYVINAKTPLTVGGTAPPVTPPPAQCPGTCGSPACKSTDTVGTTCPDAWASCLQGVEKKDGPYVEIRVCRPYQGTMKWMALPQLKGTVQ
jgi:hypothetical protein